jgi:hypothetical protein
MVRRAPTQGLAAVRVRGAIALLVLSAALARPSAASSHSADDPRPKTTNGAGPAQATAEPTPPVPETPIVDPEPVPPPIYLPSAERGVDAAKPPPVTPGVKGYVASLTAAGRRACAPATHVILALPEGSTGNEAVAVAYSAPDRPEINLDLYVTDFVEAGGLEDLAPAECRPVTRRILRVEWVRSIPLPPGAAPPTSE